MNNRFFGATAAAAFGLFVLATPAAASDVLGIGSVQCSQFNSTFGNLGAADQADVRIGLHQWSFGYFSGRNAQAGGQARDLSGLDFDDTADYIITQCQYYPNIRIFEIADTIYENLPYDGPGV